MNYRTVSLVRWEKLFKLKKSDLKIITLQLCRLFQSISIIVFFLVLFVVSLL